MPEYGPRPDRDTFRSWAAYCRYIKAVPGWRIALSYAALSLVVVFGGITGDAVLLLFAVPATAAACITLFARWFGRSQ